MNDFKKYYYEKSGSFEEPNERLYKEAISIAKDLVDIAKLPLGWKDYEETVNVYNYLYALHSHEELFERIRDILIREAVLNSPFYGGREDKKLLDLISNLSFSDYSLFLDLKKQV